MIGCAFNLSTWVVSYDERLNPVGFVLDHLYAVSALNFLDAHVDGGIAHFDIPLSQDSGPRPQINRTRRPHEHKTRSGGEQHRWCHGTGPLQNRRAPDLTLARFAFLFGQGVCGSFLVHCSCVAPRGLTLQLALSVLSSEPNLLLT